MQYEGRIVKGIGGFYYVDTADGILECRARGIFRKEKLIPLVGDLVTISVDETTGTGAVEEIHPRKNLLIRPPVANVTQMAVVVATANPKPNLYLLDKLIASAEYAGIHPLICWNKTDLDSGEDYGELYRNAGFDVLLLSAETGQQVDLLKERLKDQVTVFAGNSGVGKSSLLNRIFGTETFATGDVSSRVERGKHTTRHSELAALPFGGYIIDTPGFGSFDISLLQPENVVELFREFTPYADGCRFRDCSHTVEQGCQVLQAVEDGKIASSRHESYCALVQEIRDANKRK
ncbi:MAG: ribosome small subunit-dependent GTPase A [Clostridia bacterium]|nr:ribosome small subunit-dependent GTPase A [Clostridia bacterium]